MLNKELKQQVINSIISNPSFLGKYEEGDGILTFLNKIWDLRQMKSQDSRFKDAYEDARQHIINNNDWTMEFLFIERFKILNGDEKYFILFMEAIVSPTVRKNKEEILQYVSTINSIIQSSGSKLTLTGYFEELPVFRYRDNTKLVDLPIDIIENNIPIYSRENEPQNEYPYFKLKYDKWNDYGNITMFDLIFHKDSSIFKFIGKVKIMKRGENSTFRTLSDKFVSLAAEYCSLGQEKSYYLQLKEILGGNYHSFLHAIRDVAMFPKIHEQFENDEIFKKSLIRENSVERLARTIRFEIEDINPNEYYKFIFKHQPPYSDTIISLNFDFEYNTDFEHRIFALIGKNGTGKTRILSSLAKSLSEKGSQNFSPRKPVYGKVFTVSYSFFDRFEIPSSDASFNYVYCGLKKDNNSWKSEEDLLSDFFEAVELIKKKSLVNDWYNILSNFIVGEILDMAFDKEKVAMDSYNYMFNESKFSEIRKVLSSGQSIILFMISEILSQIRFDSLILFDEPETHLHPNAISALLNTLFSLVRKFKSFCVIATHSPLIIQEIPARNIFVIERENNVAMVRGLERESFGENLTVITQDIFGNREVPKHFINLIEELISKGKSFSEIISILESDNLPVTSNVRLYIKALTPVK